MKQQRQPAEVGPIERRRIVQRDEYLLPFLADSFGQKLADLSNLLRVFFLDPRPIGHFDLKTLAANLAANPE